MNNEKDIKDLLEEEIRSEIEKLSKMETGSKNHSDAVDSLTKLYKLKIEEVQNERNFMRQCDEFTNQSIELKLKEDQLKEQAKDRFCRLLSDGLKVGIPLTIYTVLVFKGYKYEADGYVSSPTLKGLLSKIRIV